MEPTGNAEGMPRTRRRKRKKAESNEGETKDDQEGKEGSEKPVRMPKTGRKVHGKDLKQKICQLIREFTLPSVFKMCGEVVPIGTLRNWRHQLNQGKENGAVRIAVRYSKEIKQKVWDLLKQHSYKKVYYLIEKRVPRGTLYHWERKVRSGAPLKKPPKELGFHDLEEKLFAWFRARRAKQLLVRRKDIREMAQQLAHEFSLEDKYLGTDRWAKSFETRYNISLRACNIKSKRATADMQVLISGFYTELNATLDKLQPPEIWNYDEVGVSFEPLITHTLNIKGEKNVGILSLQAHHLKMTFILLISSTGVMAPPVLLYYNKGFQPFLLPEAPEVLIISNPRGYNIEDTNYREVLPHFLKFIKEGALLIVDECKAHRSDRITKLLEGRKITCLHLPGGTTPFLQPVDSSIGKIVKSEVKNQFIRWCSEHVDEITTPEGRRQKSFQKPTNKLMATWILEGVKKVRPESIVKAFTNTGIISPERQKFVVEKRLPKCFVNKDSSLPFSSHLKSNPKPKLESDPNLNPESNSNPESEPNLESDPNSNPNPNPNPNPESDPNHKSKQKPHIKPKQQPKLKSKSEAKAEPEPEAKAEV